MRRLLALVVSVVAAGVLAAATEAGSSRTARWNSLGAVVHVYVKLDHGGSAAGTGIVISTTGLVITNNHVIRGARSVRAVDVGNGKTYAASVLGYSLAADVAVVQLSGASGLMTAPLAPTTVLERGQCVTAFGNAGGLGGAPSVEPGKILVLHRTITARSDDGEQERLTGLIETDVDLKPGESGGPLVDAAGRVIGINTASSQGFQLNAILGGQAYAIPVARALAVVRQVESGRPSADVHIGPTARLGVYIRPPAEYGFGFYTGSKGALVVAIAPHSPAAGAGLSAGDVITSFAGKRIRNTTEFDKVLLSRSPTERVSLAWVDEFGQTDSAKVVLASGPPQ